MDMLKAGGYKIAGIEQAEGSTGLGDFKLVPGIKYALVFGHEVKGVDQRVLDKCDFILEIPQFGTKHSFNLAVSAGIVLWELSKKNRGAAGNTSI